MPAVTQLIPSYIGGVSRQSDEKKSPGQVREIDNGYCDPTFGLTKRSGFQFLLQADTYTEDNDDLKDASWFFINRDDREAYFGCITTNKTIRIWNALTRVEVTDKDGNPGIDYEGNSADYLDVPAPVFPETEKKAHGNFDTLTVRAQTFIVNKTKKVEERDRETYDLGKRATVKLMSVEDDVDYTIELTVGDGTMVPCTAKLPVPDISGDDPDPPNTAKDILEDLKTAIEQNVPAITVQQFATSLELSCDQVFKIDVKGGITGGALQCYQDVVGNSSRLAATTVDKRRVKIQNTTDEKSSYFVQFQANDDQTDGGTGYWQESLGWSDDDGDNKLASPGLVSSTMPHALINYAPDKFRLEPIEYAERLVGSEVSNPAPSFVGETINSVFVYSNRLGYLSTENVILSKAADFDNFYFASAQTIIDSDPIDLNCSSIRPADLFAAIPQTQGIILFSENEQFNLFADGQFLTPLDATLRSISNYEATKSVMPVDIGTSIVFTSKTPSYTRTMAMSTRGQDNSPIIVDIGKVSASYVPSDITDLISSSQNGFIALSSQNHNKIFFYRFFNNGEQDIMQAWFKWIVPGGAIQTQVVTNDMMFAVVKGNGEYNIIGASLAQDSQSGLAGALRSVNPKVDMYYSPMHTGGVTYDSATGMSTLSRPYGNSREWDPVAIQVERMVSTFGTSINTIPLTFANVDPTLKVDQSPGYLPPITVADDGSWQIKGDWSEAADMLLVGVKYTFSVELPTTYFRNQGISDYTSVLTLSRYKFSFGGTGFVEFKSKALGSSTWNKVEPATPANYYKADSIPFNRETIITVPIYQKNKNFDFKIESDTPEPISLNSMMWEGQYSPKYYRRAG